MSINKNKYKAETFRIIGLAMLTPLGRALLDPLSLLSEYQGLALAFYVTITFTGLILGFICINRGLEIIE